MVFSVKYRDSSGAMCEKAVEAANRADCFAKCKAQGIVPIGVEAGAAAKKPAQASGPVAFGKSRLILLVAALAAIGAAVWLWPESSQLPQKKVATPVKTIKPSIKKAEVLKPATNSAPTLSKRERQLKQIRDKYGNNIPDNLKPVVYFLENPPTQIFHPARTAADIFKRSSEREIASMISTEPGTWFMRRPTFGERFDRDFAESLKDTIDINDDDTPEQKELKQAVIDTKAELASRMKAGGKPSDVMNDFAGSMYELGEYRRSIEADLSRLKKDETVSDKDIEEFVNAANQMLTSKGAKPIKMPQMLFRHISLKRAAEKRAKEQNQEMQK